MTFITLETQKNALSFYEDGKILTNSLPKRLDRTWSFNSFCDNNTTTIAQLLAECQDIRTPASEQLQSRHKEISEKIKCSLQTFKNIGIDTKDYTILDRVPKWQLVELGSTMAEIVDEICSTREKQPYYQNLVDINRVIYRISSKQIRFDAGDKQGYIPKVSSVRYKLFGSKTCRLTTGKDSFPMNIQKELRKYIIPENDGFVEIDVNGMDIRIFIALLGREQPENDIHVFNQEILGVTERSEAKQKFFSWFYDQSKKNRKLDNYYDRTILLDRYADAEYNLTTPFKKQLPSDDFHWLNHLVQTTASMTFWEQSAKVDRLLEGKRTFIKQLNHDSILLDFSDKDSELLSKLLDTFSNTRFGKFRSTMTKWDRWCNNI